MDHNCVLQVMIQILKDMGITEYEPRVINQMLEFTYSKLTTLNLYNKQINIMFVMSDCYRSL